MEQEQTRSQEHPTALLNYLPLPLRHNTTLDLIATALAEDLGLLSDDIYAETDLTKYDITSSATVPHNQVLHGRVTSKQFGTLAGIGLCVAVFKWVDPKIKVSLLSEDGAAVQPGTVVLDVTGAGRSILTAERTALNFLGRMSGIASYTKLFVEAVAGTNAVILDTRKTVPGSRAIDKYAVSMGGGKNHRMGLFDMALIKDNHIDGAGGITNAIQGFREKFGTTIPIEVEVKDLTELEEALAHEPDRIMLDNMPLDMIRAAIEITKHRVPLEVSGNVSIERVKQIAETGVDYISIGALTHSAPVLDLSLRMIK